MTEVVSMCELNVLVGNRKKQFSKAKILCVNIFILTCNTQHCVYVLLSIKSSKSLCPVQISLNVVIFLFVLISYITSQAHLIGSLTWFHLTWFNIDSGQEASGAWSCLARADRKRWIQTLTYFWGHFTSEDLGALQRVFEVYQRR